MFIEDIDSNRKLITEELVATKREGVEKLIDLMDKYGFFEATSSSHDTSGGGTANHSLWCLWFARQKCGLISRDTQDDGIPEDSLVLVCLCHDICNCSYPNIKGTEHGSRSMEILKRSGCAFTDEELDAIASHSYGTLSEACKSKSQLSYDLTSRLHCILHHSDSESIEFADSIPFSAMPEQTTCPVSTDFYQNCILDPEEHMIWLGAEGRDDVLEMTELMPEFPVHQIYSIRIRPGSNDADIAIMSDDNGLYALAFLSEESCEGHPPVYRSDKVLFGYTELIFYISRFPMYRSSYILARNAKGRWGIYRIRENKKKNGGHKIIVEKMVEFTYRYPEKASLSLRSHSKHLIGIKHNYFYTEFQCCFPRNH